MIRPLARGTPVLAILVLVSSCGDSQGPGPVTFDVDGVHVTLDAIRNTLGSGPVVAHLGLAPRFVPPEANLSATGWPAIVAHEIAILPANHMGTTFAFDAQLGSYAPTEMSGAPENALRFILYELSAGGQPDVSLPIGHADLTDEGVELENGFSIRIRATAGDITLADYTTSFVNGSANALLTRTAAMDHVGLTIDGVLRSAADQVDVRLITGTVNGTLVTEFDVASHDHNVAGRVNLDPGTGAGSLEASLEVSEDRIEVTATGTQDAYTTLVTVNETRWATVETDGDDTTVTSEGTALTATEEDVARQLAEFFVLIPKLADGMTVGMLQN